MTQFSVDGFLKDIKHVDKDLRLMALFDLRRCLPTADETTISTEVVGKVLFCLSPSESCEEVQNEAANVLPDMVVRCSQRAVIFQHLLSSVAKKRATDDCEGDNLQYLCGMAFKKCCAEFAGEARRDVGFWQRQLDVARSLCKDCAEHLAMNGLDDTSREVLYAAVNALAPAYKEALGDRDALLKQAVQDFRRTNSIRHVCLALMELLLPLVSPVTQESVVAESLRQLTDAASGEQYVAYLQFCSMELRALRVPPLASVRQVIESACSRLACATEHYDEGEGSTETLLEVVYCLLQLNAGVSALPWRGTFAAVKDLVTFDPYGAAVDDAAYADGGASYDDEYDDYYEYDSGASDSTWRLRMWASRVLQALVAQHADKELGMQALTLATSTLLDRAQDVQLEAVKLVRAVARRAYVRDEDCAAFMTTHCHTLCSLVGGADDKATAALMKALEDVFDALADTPGFCKKAVPLILGQVRTHFSALAGMPAAVEGCRRMVASAVKAASGSGVASEATVGLAKELPALCLCAGGASAAAVCIARVSDTLVQVYAATRDASIPSVLGHNYAALLENRSFPAANRAAAAESLASWVAAHGLASLEQPATALWGAIDADDVQLPVLRALGTVAGSVAAASVPLPALEKVAALLEQGPGGVRVAAIEVLLSRLSAPKAASLPAPFLQRLAALYAPGRPLSLASCELAELRPLALLLSQLLRHRANTTASVYGGYCVGAWEHVARVAEAVMWSRNLMDPAVEGLTALLADVYEREAASRAAIETDVRQLLMANQAHIPCLCAVVRCVGCGSAPVVSAFLHSLSAQLLERGHLLLCVGAAGQVSDLDQEWSSVVLDSVQSKQGELLRSCGELALSYCMLHPGNAESVLLPCGERAADAAMAGRYYYVKSIKEAATLALGRQRTPFHDANLSRRLLFLFLQSPASADLVELYGACAGLLSVFLLKTEHRLLIAEELFRDATPLDERVKCMVALRHFLNALAERDESVEAYRPTVLQALLQLHRPTGVSESTAPTLPLRSMALQLLTAVLQQNPQWLDCPEARETVFPNLLLELSEDAKLQGTFDLSGYTHRVDNGLECRKLAYESLSAVLWACRQCHKDLGAYAGVEDAIVDRIISACSSHAGGDRDSSINDTAKDLLVRFVESKPTYAFSAKQLDTLVAKLAYDIKSPASPSDAQKTTLLYTIRCVTKLGSNPVFAYHAGFQDIAEVARKSPLLSQSLKL